MDKAITTSKQTNKQEIIKYSKKDDPETKSLQEAEEKMQQLLTRINMQKRMVDTSAKVLDLQERLTNRHGPVPALISPARRFVRHGNVTEVDLSTKRVVCRGTNNSGNTKARHAHVCGVMVATHNNNRKSTSTFCAATCLCA